MLRRRIAQAIVTTLNGATIDSFQVHALQDDGHVHLLVTDRGTEHRFSVRIVSEHDRRYP
jgi:hypothetical protein